MLSWKFRRNLSPANEESPLHKEQEDGDGEIGGKRKQRKDEETCRVSRNWIIRQTKSRVVWDLLLGKFCFF